MTTNSENSNSIKKVVVRRALSEAANTEELEYWRTQPPEARLRALEEIRLEYHKWRYGAEPRLQRVYSIVKLAQC